MLEQKTATHKFALGQALQFSPALGEDNCKRFATRLFYSSPKPATCCNTGSRARWTGTSASSAKTSSAAHDKRGESHWPKVKVEATAKPRSPNPPRRNRLLRHQQSRHLRPGIGWDSRRSHDGEIRTTTAAHKRAAQSAPCRLAFRNAGSSPTAPNLARRPASQIKRLQHRGGITGRIDCFQVRNGAEHILDYRADEPIAQSPAPPAVVGLGNSPQRSGEYCLLGGA